MIQLKSVSLSLDGKQLFKDLSMDVPEGGRLLLHGRSGSGKTTLLRMLLGFVLPDHGDVIIDGEKFSLENVWKVRLKMAYISQEMQIGRGRAEKFIREIFLYRNNRQITYERKKVLSLLDDFQLETGILEKDLEVLSGGELQRFAVIVTLLLNRQIYLLDEVTSALDQPLKELIVDYFSELKDKTLIISSHDNVWYNQNFLTLDLDNHGNHGICIATGHDDRSDTWRSKP